MISLFVVVLLFAILMPVAFNQIYTTTTTSWSTSLSNIWYLVPLITVAGVLIALAYSLVKGE
ncbi:MAG: hypothetical protein QXE05_04860 [Nitrososphaeria archaeon]